MKQLVEEVEKSPEPTKKRIALTKLLAKIYQDKKMFEMPSHSELPDYEILYQQAVQDTILVIAQKTYSGESKKPFKPWIKSIFINKFYEALKKQKLNKVVILSNEDLDRRQVNR